MSFHIVRDKNTFEVVPASWVITDENRETTVWWPKSNYTELRKDETTVVDPNGEWMRSNYKIARRNYSTFKEASKVADELLELSTTDSEAEHNQNTRSKVHGTKKSDVSIPKFDVKHRTQQVVENLILLSLLFLALEKVLFVTMLINSIPL